MLHFGGDSIDLADVVGQTWWEGRVGFVYSALLELCIRLASSTLTSRKRRSRFQVPMGRGRAALSTLLNSDSPAKLADSLEEAPKTCLFQNTVLMSIK